MSEVFLETVYCDDVRTEVGHKLSYMGVYGSNFLVREFPATISKICAVMLLHLPEQTSATAIAFSMLCNDREVGRATGSMEEVRQSAMPAREVGGARFLAVRFIAQIAPLQLDEPCRLVAVAEVDGRTVTGAALLVERVPEGYSA